MLKYRPVVSILINPALGENSPRKVQYGDIFDTIEQAHLWIDELDPKRVARMRNLMAVRVDTLNG